MGNNRNFDYFHPFNLAYSKITIQTYGVQAVCCTFQSHLVKFHQILPKVIKFIDVIGTFCCSGVTFIKISIKNNNLLWYKSIHTISKSFQDVLGYKIIKLCIFINANIYLFCKLNLNTVNLKRPVNSNFIQSTIATHSTIANRQHRKFLTLLTYSLSVVSALLTFFSQFMSPWQH